VRVRMRVAGNGAAAAVRRTVSNLSILAGVAAFAASLLVVPADAKKSNAPDSERAAAVDQNQPMTIIISLRNQKANIYRGTTLITSTRVSTGKRGYSTKPGVYSILEKRRHHYSNLYGGAPMPWMQRLTWSGTALHAGVVPGYAASHGCVRLPYSFAPQLFKMTGVGDQVVIARSMVGPELVEHPALFQPLPLPMPPIMAKDHEQHQMRRSSNDTDRSVGTRLPVVFAKAEALVPEGAEPAETMIIPQALARRDAPAARPMMLAVLEDTRIHAIDPAAPPVMSASSHALPETRALSSEPTRTAARIGDPAERLDRPAAPAASKPILTTSASALSQPEPEVASVEIKMMTADDHPPMPPIKPSVTAAKLMGGTAAAAVEAAEPHSTEPLRILITRRTKRDQMIGAQYVLASMGYLDHQDFDGTFGQQTIAAIKAFQRAHELPETGAFTDELEKRLYEVAGKKEPPSGHLFVRQKFASVFDMPIRLRDPETPLGTQVFTVMHFSKDATNAQWMAIGLKDDADPTAVLDRIEIPEDVRLNISERLTPGSSLIVADTAINSATLPKGADFLVWDTSGPAHVERVSVSPKPAKKRRATSRRRTSPTYARRSRPGPFWPF
jgi:peptidoglycan hydrolase-like protein with peptidoglycan-binding domain